MTATLPTLPTSAEVTAAYAKATQAYTTVKSLEEGLKQRADELNPDYIQIQSMLQAILDIVEPATTNILTAAQAITDLLQAGALLNGALNAQT